MYQFLYDAEHEKRVRSDYHINTFKFDEKYYIKDKKNKLKAKNGATTYWPAEEFVPDINLKKSTTPVVMRIMKKDVKFVRFLLDGTEYLALAAAINYATIRGIPKVK